MTGGPNGGANGGDRAALARLEGLVRAELPADLAATDLEDGWRRLAPKIDRRAGARLWLRWAMVGAAAAGATAAAVVLRAPANPEPLAFAVEGNVTAGDRYVVAAAARPATVHFTEGTRVRFAPGARGRVVSSDAIGARLGLEHGSMTMYVVKRPQGRWSVDAGPFVVEVTGTEFDLLWSSATGVLEVALRSGSLTVRSPFSQSTLVAGQRLRASLRERDVRILGPDGDAPGAAERPQAPPPAAPTPAAARPGGRVTTAPAPWADRVRAGDYRGVLRDAHARGLPTVLAKGGKTDLTALADAALFVRETGVARRAWLATRDRFPDSFEAGQATFRLGRLAEDRERDLDEAVQWYDRYLEETPRGPHADEAMGRKMIAVRRTSGLDAARGLAQAYLRRFPEGTYAAAARELAPPR